MSGSTDYPRGRFWLAAALRKHKGSVRIAAIAAVSAAILNAFTQVFVFPPSEPVKYDVCVATIQIELDPAAPSFKDDVTQLYSFLSRVDVVSDALLDAGIVDFGSFSVPPTGPEREAVVFRKVMAGDVYKGATVVEEDHYYVAGWNIYKNEFVTLSIRAPKSVESGPRFIDSVLQRVSDLGIAWKSRPSGEAALKRTAIVQSSYDVPAIPIAWGIVRNSLLLAVFVFAAAFLLHARRVRITTGSTGVTGC